MLLFVLDAEIGTGWDQESEAATIFFNPAVAVKLESQSLHVPDM